MKITLSYQPQHLPPPFAYAAVFKFDLNNDKIEAQLDLEYLGRESVTDDELKAEGFTKNDDYSWSGFIDPNWKADVMSFASMETNPDPDAEIYLHIEVDNKQKGFAKNIRKADSLFQELMQTVIEQDQIEAPLEVQIRLNDTPYTLTWEFAKRSIHVNEKESALWETGRTIMSLIYSHDYDSLNGTKKPSKDCINLDGLWYPISNDIKEKLLSKLDKL